MNDLSSAWSDFAPLTRAPRPDAASDISIADWDDLFRAVLDRLKSTASAATPGTRVHDELIRIQGGVLECVSALDQLQTTLAHEVERHLQLELELFDARTALAQAVSELSGNAHTSERARDQTLRDGLTALPNRSCFRERLDLLLARADPKRQAIAVVCLDLDMFNQIDDAHGHDVGDQLLRIIGDRLTRAVRAEDMVSRLGGDEFGFLLMGLPGREQLGRLANKLLTVVSAPLKLGDVELTVHPSIGIAMWPDDGATAESLLKNADHASYRAKRQRTGYAFFARFADI